ncbi:hypothetical protein H0H92_007861 [Tricholoma furcatifolium]|nr:hypothetical protein H0H92_007861 [Tricholoma furcatifolium]
MVVFNYPSSFIMRDVCDITGAVFELQESPFREEAYIAVLKWFARFKAYDPVTEKKFFKSRFDTLAGLCFPDADLEKLITCSAFFLWGFATDDLCDAGEHHQSEPDQVQHSHDISRRILQDDTAPQPSYPYAGMLWDILRRLRASGRLGMYERFKKAHLDWSSAQVKQAQNRSLDVIPALDEFLVMRRDTAGVGLAEAMVEYSLDLDIPSFVWEHPTIIEISKATNDILTWPNDLCSFNKEQVDGDYQNLVCVLQQAHNLELQDAVDLLTQMITERVQDYVNLKASLPSFSPDVDLALQKYFRGLEHFVQGCVVWWYSSPRYFFDFDASGNPEAVIRVLRRESMSSSTPA